MEHRDTASANPADNSAAVPARPRPPYLRPDSRQSSSGIFDDIEMAHDEASRRLNEAGAVTTGTNDYFTALLWPHR